jgi:hypothetical protein
MNKLAVSCATAALVLSASSAQAVILTSTTETAQSLKDVGTLLNVNFPILFQSSEDPKVEDKLRVFGVTKRGEDITIAQQGFDNTSKTTYSVVVYFDPGNPGPLSDKVTAYVDNNNKWQIVAVSEPEPKAKGVPEPQTWALMLIGVAGVGAALRRRRRARTWQNRWGRVAG